MNPTIDIINKIKAYYWKYVQTSTSTGSVVPIAIRSMVMLEFYNIAPNENEQIISCCCIETYN